MGVDLCGNDGAVAQHLLHSAKVGATLKEVRGKSVAEGVGAD